MAETKAKQPEKKTAAEKPAEAKAEAVATEIKPQGAQQNEPGFLASCFILAILVLGTMFIFGWGPFKRHDREGEPVDLKDLTVAEACEKAKDKGWSDIYVTVYRKKGSSDNYHQGDCDGDSKVYDFELNASNCEGVNTPDNYKHLVCLKSYEEDGEEVKAEELKPETNKSEAEAQAKEEAAKKAEEEKKKAEAEKPKEDSSSSNSTSSSSSSASTSSSASSSSTDEYTIPDSELYTGLAACARALTNQGYNNVNMPAGSYVRGYTAAEPYKWYIVTKPTYKDKTFGSNIQLSQVVCLYNWKTGDAKITYINK